MHFKFHAFVCKCNTYNGCFLSGKVFCWKETQKRRHSHILKLSTCNAWNDTQKLSFYTSPKPTRSCCPVSSEDRLVMNCHWPIRGDVGVSHACQRRGTDSRDWGKVDLGSPHCLYWQFVSLHSIPLPLLIPVGCRIIIVSFNKKHLSIFTNVLTGI